MRRIFAAAAGGATLLRACRRSVYGVAARKEFLNGKFMWRDHIRFFVNYTVAKVQKNKAARGGRWTT